MKRLATPSILCGLLVLVLPVPCLAEDVSVPLAQQSLRRAVEYFRTKVATRGGYLWRYSEDLSKREGENRASANTVWVQPPGTPSIGEAYLGAFHATRDPTYLDAAQDVANALVLGQLESGGWDYRIEFGEERSKYAYRREAEHMPGARNVTTLDDNTTQAALQFLMHVDQALRKEDTRIHEASMYALDRLLAAQYPNGAWPQRFSEPPDAAQFPVLAASYPDNWPREHPDVDYRSYYTFNDNTLADMIETMFEAERVYGDARYGAAARRGGDFILLAQMPKPQPAWAQQYNAEMQPAWARRFEPASVTGGETQGILRVLMMLYRETGNEKYLEPIPRALDYLNASKLNNGQLARFYELKTNRPLYFTKQYVLTYSDADMPTHYGFKVASRIDSLQSEFEFLMQTDVTKRKPKESSSPKMTVTVAAKAQHAIDNLNADGAWVVKGQMKNFGPNDPTERVIDCREFIANVESLCQFISASSQ